MQNAAKMTAGDFLFTSLFTVDASMELGMRVSARPTSRGRDEDMVQAAHSLPQALRR